MKSLYIKDIIDSLLSAGITAAGVIFAVVMLAIKGPIRERILSFFAKMGHKKLAEKLNALSQDSEVQQLVTTLKEWKKDTSKQGVANRKEAAKRLASIMSEAGIREGDLEEGLQILKSRR